MLFGNVIVKLPFRQLNYQQMEALATSRTMCENFSGCQQHHHRTVARFSGVAAVHRFDRLHKRQYWNWVTHLVCSIRMHFASSLRSLRSLKLVQRQLRSVVAA